MNNLRLNNLKVNLFQQHLYLEIWFRDLVGGKKHFINYYFSSSKHVFHDVIFNL